MNRLFVTTAPVSEALTRSSMPARSAVTAMTSSVRLPSVALSSPPTASPVLAATLSVAWLNRPASGTIATTDKTKRSVCASGRRCSATRTTGTNTRNQYRGLRTSSLPIELMVPSRRTDIATGPDTPTAAHVRQSAGDERMAEKREGGVAKNGGKRRKDGEKAFPEITLEDLVDRARKLARLYRVKDVEKFRLKDVDPGDTAWLKTEDKPAAKEALQHGVDALAKLQDMLYAQDRWAVLLIFQAMDAAGKDGAIKHVMSGINPQGCQVVSFKAPSSEDLDHDFLWRCAKQLPERGRIGIFNRSYYEEVLVVR